MYATFVFLLNRIRNLFPGKDFVKTVPPSDNTTDIASTCNFATKHTRVARGYGLTAVKRLVFSSLIMGSKFDPQKTSYVLVV